MFNINIPVFGFSKGLVCDFTEIARVDKRNIFPAHCPVYRIINVIQRYYHYTIYLILMKDIKIDTNDKYITIQNKLEKCITNLLT